MPPRNLIQKPVSDLALAKRVLEAVKIGDDIDTKCAEWNLDAWQCPSLKEALKTGFYYNETPEITFPERNDLERNEFTKEFLDTLAGPDGKRALRERVKWLGDCLNKASVFGYGASYIQDLGALGREAHEFLPMVVSASRKFSGYNLERGLRAVANIEPDEFAKAFYLSSVCFGEGEEGDLGKLVAGLMNKDEAVRNCSYQALNEMLKTNFEIPPSGISLIKQAYRHFAGAGDRGYRLLLLQLINKIESPNDETLLFAEEAMREGAKNHDDPIIGAAYTVLLRARQQAVPISIRLLEEKSRSLLTNGILPLLRLQHLFEDVSLQPEDFGPYLSALSKLPNEEYGSYSFLNPIVGAKITTPGFDPAPIYALYEKADDGPRRMILAALKKYQENGAFELAKPLLVKALASDDDKLANFASSWISEDAFAIKSSALWLFDLCASEQEVLRYRATTALVSIVSHNFNQNRFPESILQLTHLLEDPSARVRQSAATGLWLMFEADRHMALPFLVGMKYSDPEEACRRAADLAIQAIEEDVL